MEEMQTAQIVPGPLPTLPIQDAVWACMCFLGLPNWEAGVLPSALGIGVPGLTKLGELLEIA